MQSGSGFSTLARGILVAGSVVVVASVVRAEENSAAPHGRVLFETYCTSCHGPGGRGDGRAVAALEVPVPDLTLLSCRNHGTFPREEAFCAIDGRDSHHAHDTWKMPIWGLSLQDLEQDTNQEAEVRCRIEDLVQYLESIQTLD